MGGWRRLVTLVAVVLLVPLAALVGSERASAAGDLSSSATVSAAVLAPGERIWFTVSVVAGQAVEAIVDLEVYDAAGAQVYQHLWTGQQFPAGGSARYAAAWWLPGSAVNGGYTVRVGLFDRGWGVLNWNSAAAGFTVRGARLGLAGLPARPAGWPATNLLVGQADPPGGAGALALNGGLGARYQYLAGGVTSGDNWQHWNPSRPFVTEYVNESATAGLLPVFTYYALRQSAPGGSEPDEQRADLANLTNAVTMTAYYNDLAEVFRQAGQARGPVVVQIEPDLWGFAHAANAFDDASATPAVVSGTGLAELAGLPDNLAGFAQAVVRLRDNRAPNVLVAYSFSLWGAGTAFDGSLADVSIDALAHRSAVFYLSLGARFDLTVGEFTDRDSQFHVATGYNAQNAWWDLADFDRHLRFVDRFTRATGRRALLWQIPLGNTHMRAMDNSWGHFQDNRVQTLLSSPPVGLAPNYAAAGVLGLLFGPGAPGTTCACDAAGDGVTNPAPINGNNLNSFNADDDGGLFKALARALPPIAVP